MAYFYMDTDTGNDADNGTTWALAKLTLEGLLAVMSAGDIGVIQGAATDTAAAARTFTSPGTTPNPCKIIGVVDGTTNTGTSIVPSDLAATLPKIECTGAGNDVTFAGNATYINLHFSAADRLIPQNNTQFVNSKLTCGGRFANAALTRIINSEVEFTTTGIGFWPTSGSIINMYGGTITFTAATEIVYSTAAGIVNLYGVDLSGLTAPIRSGTGGGGIIVKLVNCRMPASFTLFGSSSAATSPNTIVEVIASDDSSSVGATSSIQDYMSETAFGTVDLETTIVRTGGADDGASGAFAYGMTPRIDSTLESSNANLASPWIAVWVAGGSNTLTVYICNDSASTDFNEDEAWVEFYTPDAGDTAQHDQTFDPADERLLDSSTIVTDDTGSTWGTGGNNHQKLSVAVTTGFEGWAYARLHYAKRFAASPVTLYVDPKIEVT